MMTAKATDLDAKVVVVKQVSLFGRGSADFSACGNYRYRLERNFGPVVGAGPAVVFVMLNPSSADADDNDPTVSRCVNFARNWGYERLLVVNLFAFISTDPAGLDDASQFGGVDPVGPENDACILAAARSAKLVVCAWGTMGAYMGRDKDVLSMLRQYGRTPHAIGLTSGGFPKHPLARGQHAISRDAKPFVLVDRSPPGPDLPAAA